MYHPSSSGFMTNMSPKVMESIVKVDVPNKNVTVSSFFRQASSILSESMMIVEQQHYIEQCTSPLLFRILKLFPQSSQSSLRNYGIVLHAIFVICTHAQLNAYLLKLGITVKISKAAALW